MRGLSFAGGLLLAVLAHVLGSYLWAPFPRAFDVFLVWVVFHALGGNILVGLFGGLAAGLVTDVLSGGPYGMFGIADTILGYGGALLARNLVIQRTLSVLLVFCLAAAAQQTILLALSVALLSDPDRPTLFWVATRVATTGLLGVSLVEGEKVVRGVLERRRRRSTARLR